VWWIEERKNRASALRDKPLRFRNLAPLYGLTAARPLRISKIKWNGFIEFEGHSGEYDPGLFEGDLYTSVPFVFSCKLPRNEFRVRRRNGFRKFGAVRHPIDSHCRRPLYSPEIMTANRDKFRTGTVTPMRVSAAMLATSWLKEWKTRLKASMPEHAKAEHGPTEGDGIEQWSAWHILNHPGDANRLQKLTNLWDQIVCAGIRDAFAFHDLSRFAVPLTRRACPDEIKSTDRLSADRKADGLAAPPIDLKSESIGLNQAEGIARLRVDVYPCYLKTGAMQPHRSATSRTKKIKRFSQFSSLSAYAFSAPSSLVLAGKPESHRLSCRAVRESLSCRQPLVGQTLAVNCA
jgi:hypothetical protein